MKLPNDASLTTYLTVSDAWLCRDWYYSWCQASTEALELILWIRGNNCISKRVFLCSLLQSQAGISLSSLHENLVVSVKAKLTKLWRPLSLLWPHEFHIQPLATPHNYKFIVPINFHLPQLLLQAFASLLWLWICSSLRILGSWLVPRPQFTDSSKKRRCFYLFSFFLVKGWEWQLPVSLHVWTPASIYILRVSV